jgi:outer membrane protease
MKNMAKDSTKITLLEDIEEFEEEHGSDDSETENSKLAHFANFSINNYVFLLAQKEEIIFSNCGFQEIHLELSSPPPRFS